MTRPPGSRPDRIFEMRPRSPVEQLAVELLQARLPTWRAGHRKQIPLSATPEVLDTVTRLRRLGVRIGISLQALESSRSGLSLWRRWKARTERQQARQAWRAAHLVPRLNALLPAERAAILACRGRHPVSDFRRMVYHLEREHGIHLAPVTVYHALKEAGRLCGSRHGPRLWNGHPATPPPQGPGQQCAVGYLIVRRAEGSPIDAPDLWLLLAIDVFSRKVVKAELLPFNAGNVEVRRQQLKVLGSLPQDLQVTAERADLLVAVSDLGAFLAEHDIRLQREWSLGFTETRRFGRLPRFELAFKMGEASQARLPEMRELFARLIPEYNSSFPILSRGLLPPDDLQRGPAEVVQLLEKRARLAQEARRHREEVNRAARRQAGTPPVPTQSDPTPSMSTVCHAEGAA